MLMFSLFLCPSYCCLHLCALFIIALAEPNRIDGHNNPKSCRNWHVWEMHRIYYVMVVLYDGHFQLYVPAIQCNH